VFLVERDPSEKMGPPLRLFITGRVELPHIWPPSYAGKVDCYPIREEQVVGRLYHNSISRPRDLTASCGLVKIGKSTHRNLENNDEMS
jgi:hypothetical protein